MLVCATPPAQAHYLEPPGDWNAAPAVVQVEITFRYVVNIVDSQQVVRRYPVDVPGPRGTGAIFDPSGTVLTTRATVTPDDGPFRVEAVNRGFDAARPPGWTTPPDRTKRHTVKDPATNRQLQGCYSAESGCLTLLGRVRDVSLNTVPEIKLARATGAKDIGDGLVVLPTTAVRSEETPTVGIAGEFPLDSSFVALGYDDSRKLSRFSGQLVDGALTDGDAIRVRKTFANDGAGVVLVGPGGKGSILGVVVPTEDEIQLVAAQAGLAKASYRPVRGLMHQRIDDALGFFNGAHYTHAVPLLENVTRTLPDAELVKDLKVAKAKAGTDQDKTYSMDSTTPTEGSRLPWTRIGLAGVVAGGAAVVALLLLRRRADRRVETRDDGYDDFGDFDDFDDDAAVAAAPAQADPGAPAGSASAATQPMGRTDPGVAVVEAHRPAENQTSVRYCTSCGAALAAGDRFCYSCGTPVR